MIAEVCLRCATCFWQRRASVRLIGGTRAPAVAHVSKNGRQRVMRALRRPMTSSSYGFVVLWCRVRVVLGRRGFESSCYVRIAVVQKMLHRRRWGAGSRCFRVHQGSIRISVPMVANPEAALGLASLVFALSHAAIPLRGAKGIPPKKALMLCDRNPELLGPSH